MKAYEVHRKDGRVQQIEADGYYRPTNPWSSVYTMMECYTFYKEVPHSPGLLDGLFGSSSTDTREVARVSIDDVDYITEAGSGITPKAGA